MSESIKKNGKSFGKWVAAAALTAMFIFNVGFNAEMSFDNGRILNVDLSSIVANNQAMAEQDGRKGLCCDLIGWNCTNEGIYFPDTQWEDGRDFCI